MGKGVSRLSVVLLLTVLGVLLLITMVAARERACVPFHLKTEDGKIINPLTGEDADQPYSPRRTCGPCHNYDEITKGFHFQQGWDVIKDDFKPKMPWVLSDGMLGKF